MEVPRTVGQDDAPLIRPTPPVMEVGAQQKTLGRHVGAPPVAVGPTALVREGSRPSAAVLSATGRPKARTRVPETDPSDQ